MSRSKRKISIRGVTTAASEKRDKRSAGRKLRRLVKEKLKKREEDLPVLREVSDVWDFQKDGKIFHKNEREKIMRK